MYNSDLNRAVNRFWLSHAPSASVGRQVLAKLERLIRTPLHEIGERRVTLFNWTLDVRVLIKQPVQAGAQRCLMAAPDVPGAKKPLYFVHILN